MPSLWGPFLKMQLTFSCLDVTYLGLEETLSSHRLGRYLGAAKGDKHYALRLYVWNARLCEAAYFPSQICEVAVRNAIHRALLAKFGENWHERGGFMCTLRQPLREQLDAVVRDEMQAYGAEMNYNHLISGLSFGFWQNLLTTRYDDMLWPRYLRLACPHMPIGTNVVDLHNRVERFRLFRNKMAHHKPIFDRSPTREYENVLTLVSWICPETCWFLKVTSQFGRAVSSKPLT
jgi:hypothetical protein